jgi:hypothetical protein
MIRVEGVARLGGKGLPQNAPASEKWAMVEKLYAMSGT